MAPTAPDQAVASAAAGPSAPPQNQAPVVPPAGAGPYDYSHLQFNNLEPAQLLKLLRSLPGVFGSMDASNPKQDAAQTLSNLSQNSFPNQPALTYQGPPPVGVPGINDPGPSSHPRGPPNLGQLSAVALQAAPAVPQGPPQPQLEVPKQQAVLPNPTPQSPGDGNDGQELSSGEADPNPVNTTPTTSAAGGRRGRNPAIGTDEWTRQRKDNHKEVERRRRGNINEGINELGRIVPNGTGEKAKGAILGRAVQYIHHLKENEARNIEKWTLEKLLMDQAMGDLQGQLEEVKRLWDEERSARQRLEAELELLRRQGGVILNKDDSLAGTKRRNDGDLQDGSLSVSVELGDGERDGKRQRTE